MAIHILDLYASFICFYFALRNKKSNKVFS